MIKELVAKIGLDNSGFVSSVKETENVIGKMKSSFANATKELKEKVKALTDVKGLYGQLKNQLTTNIQTFGLFKGVLVTAKTGVIALKGAVVSLMGATGIGLLVVALGSLIAYLTTTQEGMDKLRRVTEPVKQIFERLLGVLQNLGGNVLKGISQILNGELREGFKTIGNGARQAGKETVAAFSEGIEAGTKLAKLTEQINAAQLEFLQTNSDLTHEIEKQKDIAKDRTKSEQERNRAAKEVIRLIGQRADEEKKVINLEIERLKLSQQANDTDNAGKRELIELTNRLRDVENSASKEKRRFQNEANADMLMQLALKKELIKAERDHLKEFLKLSKGMGKGRNPFVETEKYSKETLKNVAEISNTLIGSKLYNEGIILSDEHIKNYERGIDKSRKLTFETEMGIAAAAMLGQTFQSAFQAMLMSGELSFKGLINGLKALIAQLIAAAVAAFALNALLGGLGIGGGAFGITKDMGGFKDLFSSMTGLPRFAKGGMVSGLTTAVLGDNPSGKEAVIPFERMGEFLGKFGGGGTQRVEVVGNFRNDAIYFSNASYSQRRNRILGY